MSLEGPAPGLPAASSSTRLPWPAWSAVTPVAPGAAWPAAPRLLPQEALVCRFLEAASIALTLAMRSCAG